MIFTCKLCSAYCLYTYTNTHTDKHTHLDSMPTLFLPGNSIPICSVNEPVNNSTLYLHILCIYIDVLEFRFCLCAGQITLAFVIYFSHFLFSIHGKKHLFGDDKIDLVVHLVLTTFLSRKCGFKVSTAAIARGAT